MIRQTKPLAPEQPGTAAVPGHADSWIDDLVRRRIAACPYRFVFNRISWEFTRGTLRLHGCLPSFYLKQTLQELFRDIEGVECILNEIDVVSAHGISSERSGPAEAAAGERSPEAAP